MYILVRFTNDFAWSGVNGSMTYHDGRIGSVCGPVVLGTSNGGNDPSRGCISGVSVGFGNAWSFNLHGGRLLKGSLLGVNENSFFGTIGGVTPYRSSASFPLAWEVLGDPNS